MEELEATISRLRQIIKEQGLDFTKGLPESLFVFATTLMPVINIDILASNEKGEVLLTWRDDKFYGQGWHIPGGCIRIRESVDDRVRITALTELGTKVNYKKEDMIVREYMEGSRPWLDDELERCHNISLLFPATVPKDYVIDNKGKKEHDVGYIKWFNCIPEDLLDAHKKLYGDILIEHFKTLGGNDND